MVCYLISLSHQTIHITINSDHLKHIISLFSQAIISSIHTSHPHCTYLLDPLGKLAGMENRPGWLAKMAYEWCSVICENYSSLKFGEELLFLALEIGFRHFDLQPPWMRPKLTHTEHHLKLVDIIFEGDRDGEAIADLLCALTMGNANHYHSMLVEKCAKLLINLAQRICDTQYLTIPTQTYHYSKSPDKPINHLSSSKRLRTVALHTIEYLCIWKFKLVEVEGFCELINSLHVSPKDISHGREWMRLLLDTVQTSEGINCLSLPYWELLAELIISYRSNLRGVNWYPVPYRSNLRSVTWSPHIMESLECNQEWDKLGCWIAVGWILLGESVPGGSTEVNPLQTEGTYEPEQQIEQWSEGCQNDLKNGTLSLFRKQPGAIQKLKQWIEQSSKASQKDVPRAFQQICEQAYSSVTQQGVL